MQDGSTYIMQQDTQIMSLHADERIKLNNVIFYKKKLHKAKSLNYPCASVKITKYGTNKCLIIRPNNADHQNSKVVANLN